MIATNTSAPSRVFIRTSPFCASCDTQRTDCASVAAIWWIDLCGSYNAAKTKAGRAQCIRIVYGSISSNERRWAMSAPAKTNEMDPLLCGTAFQDSQIGAKRSNPGADPNCITRYHCHAI